MATFKVPKEIIPDAIYPIRRTDKEEHKNLVEVANNEIKESRTRERNAWIEAREYFSLNYYNESLESKSQTINMQSEEKVPRLIKK